MSQRATERVVREILSEWTDVVFQDHGAFELIAGRDPNGTFRVGHSQLRDAEEVARDMAAMARAEIEAPVQASQIVDALAHEILGTSPQTDEPERGEGWLPRERGGDAEVAVRYEEITHAQLSAGLARPSDAPAIDPPPLAPVPDLAGADGAVGSDGGVVGVGGQAGTLIDQRKNEISTSIDLRAKDLKDPAQAVIQNTNIAELTNLIIMGLANDEQRAMEATYRAVEAHVGKVDAVASALKLSLTTMTLDQLDMFDVAAYPWPVWAAG